MSRMLTLYPPANDVCIELAPHRYLDVMYAGRRRWALYVSKPDGSRLRPGEFTSRRRAKKAGKALAASLYT